MHVWAAGSSTYAMFPELFDYSQAEDIGYLCFHRKTGGQDVSILNKKQDRSDHDLYTFDHFSFTFQLLI